MDAARAAKRITVTGIVQGVGFRPFVYTLATRLTLTGQVRNTPGGVDILAFGPPGALSALVHALEHEPPPLAHIEAISVTDILPQELDALDPAVLATFQIVASGHNDTKSAAFVPVSPDVATCADCLTELLDPRDRRYRYPFINCTNCGPRYTIIRDVPYDRPATTMATFVQCPACYAEYTDPADRRFHAQPNACPVCGPRIWLQRNHAPAKYDDTKYGDAALVATQAALCAGEIVAIKGIGGFHLACDATNAQAVGRLRVRKGRAHKPFAVVAAGVDTALRYVRLSPAAQRDLCSSARPIVLAPRRHDTQAAELPAALAPGNHRLGIMLPYTPLHHLLFLPTPDIPMPPQLLVMTSGNLSDEPIAHDNAEALERLATLADAFLLHDRPIHIPCDDSVLAHTDNVLTPHAATAPDSIPIPIRRSRGNAPRPLTLPIPVAPVLAVGGELKNTICVARDGHAFLSGHIGDLENLATLAAFQKSVDHLRTLFRVQPQVIACDLHPAYQSTRWAGDYAQQNDLSLIQVQHHHAHVAALLTEHGLPAGATIIGVVLDGTGYGPGGTIWGGEFLLAGYGDYRRVGRMRPFPLPGGDAAIRRPYRTALAALQQAGVEWHPDLPCVAACPPAEQTVLAQQLARDFNCVPTSSMGRLFDAVAALSGVCSTATYEAQGAIELEALCHLDAPTAAQASPDPVTWQSYSFSVNTPVPLQDPSTTPESAAPNLGNSGQDHVEFEIDIRAMLVEIASALRAGAPVTGAPPLELRAHIARRFHATVAALIVAGCREIRRRHGLAQVGLTGGVFQNATLLALAQQSLHAAGFDVLVHRRVPPNDGGLALGQAVIAGHARHANSGRASDG